MRVLFIKPPYTLWDTSSVPGPPVSRAPIGMAYIASYLRKHGYSDITILDGYKGGEGRQEGSKVVFGTPLEEILEEARRLKPDVVGISCLYTSFYYDSIQVAEGIKKVLPGVPVVLGGSHASAYPSQMAHHPAVDVVVKGEGEKVFLEIVRRLEKKEGLSGIPNTAMMHEGRYEEQAYHELEHNLDEYPMPAYDLLDMASYIASFGASYCREVPAASVITSRGCPNNCTYCSVAQLYGRGWRHHSAQRVADEIEYLQKTYGYREIIFQDDSISANPKHLEAICDEIIKRKLDISWNPINGIAHWTLTKPLLKKMKKSGCYRVTFGIESGNPEIRKFIGKGNSDLEQAREMLRYANSIGLWTICTFILGFPQETREQMMDTINYALRCGADFAVFYRLIFFPRTPVYEYARREGLLDYEPYLDPQVKDSWVALYKATSINCFPDEGRLSKHFTNREVNAMVFMANQMFLKQRLISYLNPLRILRKLMGWKEMKYGLKIIFKGLVVIWRFAANGGRFTYNLLWTGKKV